MAELNIQQILDAGLVPVREAAVALGIPEKRLIGFILRNELRDPIGGWLPDAGMAVYGWSCRHIADTSAGSAIPGVPTASEAGGGVNVDQ